MSLYFSAIKIIDYWIKEMTNIQKIDLQNNDKITGD